MALSEFDPDKVYQEICQAHEQIKKNLTGNRILGWRTSIVFMVVGWEALNEWMSKGGHPPAPWAPLSKQPEVGPRDS